MSGALAVGGSADSKQAISFAKRPLSRTEILGDRNEDHAAVVGTTLSNIQNVQKSMGPSFVQSHERKYPVDNAAQAGPSTP